MGGTIELIGMGLGAMGSTDFTKLLFLLSIAQRLEWRGQTQKDGGSNPTKVKFTTYERKTNRINILLIVHHLLVMFLEHHSMEVSMLGISIDILSILFAVHTWNHPTTFT